LIALSSQGDEMARDILEAYDEAYRIGRAKLIEKHYDVLVGHIHQHFQEHIIQAISPELIVKEITKFDYMTNLKANGDRHLWINFLDTHDVLHYFEAVKYVDDKEVCFLDKEVIKSTLQPSIQTLAKMCLGVFRRGYDKPET